MPGSALIGNLAVNLSLETAAFHEGTTIAEKRAQKFADKMQKMGQRVTDFGKKMTGGVTLPLAALGIASVKMAATFETAMNEAQISTQASAEEFAKMRDLALDIGKSTTKSASESAAAMDMLAKAGMTVTQILNGGARAAVALAEAAGSELEPAAAAITDTMQQFKKSTSDLPLIVNNITGAVNQSKFGFEDFQLGMAQAGGVAASAGVEFEDFTAALAATASQFASGSDAGTSLKTFLMRLEPETKKQAAAFKELGLQFYDSEGQMKSLAEVAQILQDKFGQMSEQDRTAIFKQLFGTDAIRSAIGLMQQGAAGIEAMQKKIAATDASAQAAQRMKGLNAELEKMRGALETLAIKMADSGLLSGITTLVTKVASLVEYLAGLNPAVVKWGVAIAGVAAALGPLMMVFGPAVGLFAKLLPILVPLASGIIGVGKAVALLAIAGGPLTLALAAVGGLYLAFKNWDKIKPIVQNMVAGVAAAIRGVLHPILDGIKQKVDAVTGWFRGMYDKVVGHSYVPDMVAGIGAEMQKLDALMVAPAKAATSKTAQAFAELAGRVNALLARLFPEAARENQFVKELADIEAYAKKAGWSVEQLNEAIRRLQEEKAAPLLEGDMEVTGLDGTPLDELPDNEEIEKFLGLNRDIATQARMTADETIRAYGDMAAGVIGSIRGLSEQLKSGDILGALESVLRLATDVLGVLSQTGVLKLPTTPAGAPRAARGIAGTFGGRGGTDANLLSMNGRPLARVSRGERFGVFPANQNHASGGIAQIIPSPYFDVVVDGRAQRVAGPMAAGAALAGAAGAGRYAARRALRSIP